MEAAAFFAVAQFRRVIFAQMIYGGDDVSGSEWNARDWHSRELVREKLFWLAAEACLTLAIREFSRISDIHYSRKSRRFADEHLVAAGGCGETKASSHWAARPLDRDAFLWYSSDRKSNRCLPNLSVF
jgi:hypothetical protein